MKSKDVQELREKTLAELDTQLKDKKEELFNLRFKNALGQLDNNMAISNCKRDIARVKTIIRQRETQA